MTSEYKHTMWVEHESDYQAAAWPTDLEDECSRCGCSGSWCECEKGTDFDLLEYDDVYGVNDVPHPQVARYKGEGDECYRCGFNESWCDCTPVCKECGNYVENCECVGE